MGGTTQSRCGLRALEGPLRATEASGLGHPPTIAQPQPHFLDSIPKGQPQMSSQISWHAFSCKGQNSLQSSSKYNSAALRCHKKRVLSSLYFPSSLHHVSPTCPPTSVATPVCLFCDPSLLPTPRGLASGDHPGHGCISLHARNSSLGLIPQLKLHMAQTEDPSGCGAASPSQGRWDPDSLRPALRLGGQASVDCSPPGFSVHGILQARILEWVAISFSRASSPPRD